MIDSAPAMKDARCLVLGGSGHVGRAVCRALARGGARTAFTYWSREAEALALQAELEGSLALRADLRLFDAAAGVVAKALAALGGLDVLVQCAGSAGSEELYRSSADGKIRLADVDEAELDAMFDLTVKGTFAAIRAAAPALAASGRGHIVLVGALDGLKPLPSPPHYAAAKGALLAMTQALAQEFGPKGVLVNLVAPGLLDGGLSRILAPSLVADYVKHSAMKRPGTAAEAAELVAWLALENTYVSGQAIPLDGGL